MTRSTTRWTLAGCMALAALSAAAVLDVVSTTADAAPSVSRFAGTYVWSGWPATVTISDGGRITSSYSGAERYGGSTSGRVEDDGSYSFATSETFYIEPERRKPFWHTSRDQYAGNMASGAAGNIVLTDDTHASFSWLRQ